MDWWRERGWQFGTCRETQRESRFRFAPCTSAIRSALSIATILCLPKSVAFPGELRLQYSELSALIRSKFGDDVLVVSCDAAAMSLERRGSGGRLKVGFVPRSHGGDDHGGNSRDLLELNIPAFSVLGGRYVACPSRPLSMKFEADAVPGNLQLVFRGRERIAFSIQCQSGACTDAAILPQLVWHTPQIRLSIGVSIDGDLSAQTNSSGSPIGGGAKSLEISEMRISGQLELVCADGWGFAPIVCAAAKSAIGGDLTERVQMAIETWRESVNARGLGFFVELGIGSLIGKADGVDRSALISVENIEGDDYGVRFSFCLQHECE